MIAETDGLVIYAEKKDPIAQSGHDRLLRDAGCKVIRSAWREPSRRPDW